MPTRGGNDIGAKVAHVTSQGQTRPHDCHGGCGKQCPPSMWGCRECWYKLPLPMRNEIWQTYKIGQEITLTPSQAYLDIAHKAETFLRELRERGTGNLF